MTTQPALAAFGANSREILLPAENKAICAFLKSNFDKAATEKFLICIDTSSPPICRSLTKTDPYRKISSLKNLKHRFPDSPGYTNDCNIKLFHFSNHFLLLGPNSVSDSFSRLIRVFNKNFLLICRFAHPHSDPDDEAR